MLSLSNSGKSSGEPEIRPRHRRTGKSPRRKWFHRGRHRLITVAGEPVIGVPVARISRWLELNPPQSIRDWPKMWRRIRFGSMDLLVNPWTGEQWFEWSGTVHVPDQFDTPVTATLSVPWEPTEIPALVTEP